MGGTTRGAKKAAQQQADATITAANMTAANDRLTAQAAQQSTETAIAQDKAAREAAAMLSTPLESVDVALGSNTEKASVDSTGKRRTTRSKFTTAASTSGIKI